MATSTPPTTAGPRLLPPDVAAIRAHLADLVACDQWVLWRHEMRDGKPTKVPYTIRTPRRRASTAEPQTWGSFADAADAYAHGEADGLGFVLTPQDPFVVIDLDRCIDPDEGLPRPGAQSILAEVESYAEVSPSGGGLHLIAQGSLPPGGRKRGSTEMYDSGRFITITGRHVTGTPDVPHDCTASVARLHARIFGEAPPAQLSPVNLPVGTTDRTDAEVFDKARRNHNVDHILEGRWTDLGVYPSQSEADLALCAELAYWVGPDPQRIDRLFRQTPLYRAKWDSTRSNDGRTYGDATIAKALAGRTQFDARVRGSDGDLSSLSSFVRRDPVSRSSAETEADTPPRVTPFPVEVLPHAIGAYVTQSAATIGVPPDLIAVPLLTCAGAVLGNAYRIQLKNNYEQYVILYTAVVAPPGSAKSPALDAARYPLDVLQQEAITTY